MENFNNNVLKINVNKSKIKKILEKYEIFKLDNNDDNVNIDNYVNKINEFYKNINIKSLRFIDEYYNLCLMDNEKNLIKDKIREEIISFEYYIFISIKSQYNMIIKEIELIKNNYSLTIIKNIINKIY